MGNNVSKILVLAFAFERKAQKHPAAQSFYNKISSLFSVKPTEEEWNSWLLTNATVLGSLSKSEKWKLDEHDGQNCLLLNHRRKYYLITPNPNVDNMFDDVESTAILKPVPPIKTLWLAIGTAESTDRIVLTKQFAHDGWLDTALHEMFKTDRRRKELFESFVNSNKEAIDKLRRNFSVADPLFIGGGEDGAAFDLGNGRILKLFKDEIAYQKTKEAFDRLHTNPVAAKTEAMIYDIGFLGKYMGFDDVYYSILEKMEMIPNRDTMDKLFRVLVFMRDRIMEENNTTGKWKKIKDIFRDDPKKSKSILNAIKKETKKLSKYYIKNVDKNLVYFMTHNIPKLKPNWLELYMEEVLMKYITGRVDLHMGNLGITEYGELRYFDPAYGDHQSFKNR